MKVLKFGGSSMSEGFENVKKISVEAVERDDSTVIVVSAFKNVTNALFRLGELVEQGKSAEMRQEFETLKQMHLELIEKRISKKKYIAFAQTHAEDRFQELSENLEACLTLKVLPPKIKDLIASFGERLSAFILMISLHADGDEAGVVDARELIKTNDRYGNASVDFETTNELISKYFEATRKKISVVTGFIGSAPDGTTTTLGRGGSDYTAAIFAAALDAEEIQLWKEVDGVLSADPKLVHGAKTVTNMSYDEMRGLAVAGAKIVHPPAVLPAEKKKIPIRVLNTFNRSHPGTLIDAEKDEEEREVKVVSSLNDVTVITISGSAIHEGAGVDHRVTTSTKLAGANVLMKSQANEDSICYVVSNEHAEKAKEELLKEFAKEVDKEAVEMKAEPNHAVLSVVGEGMRDRAGVSARLFTTLAKSGVSVHVIAQDAKELCIAVAIPQADLKNALQVVHDEFVLEEKQVNLFIIGPGRVGKEVVTRLAALRDEHRERHGVNFRIAGIINSKRMLLAGNGGIPFEQWEEKLNEGEVADLSGFVDRILSTNQPHSVVLDMTASEAPVDQYERLVENNKALVGPNKKGPSGPLERWEKIKAKARRNNTTIGYETTVGAALPVIGPLRDAIEGGDEVRQIDGMLSGTLGYIFSNFDGSKPFSEVVQDAYEKGYTEPNPADDLNLSDVARKIVILAREAGARLELSDVKIVPILSKECLEAKDRETFFRELRKSDEHFDMLYKASSTEGKRLRVIERFENGEASIQMLPVGPEHPAYYLTGAKNLVGYITRDHANGWQVSGAGAGIDVTASGVIADLVKAAKHT
jgi:aspartokinase/homoserine dehydrogenase 1